MTLQVAEISLEATVPAGPVLQVAEISLSVTATTIPPKLTGTTTAAGAGVVTVQGGTDVTFTLMVDGTYTSTSWTVLPDSLPVPLSGTDTVKTVTAPYLKSQGVIRVSVTATGPGGTSTPYVFAVTILAHTSWYLDAAGVWQSRRGRMV